MKLISNCLLLIFIICSSAFAQTDTTTRYYWGNWKECSKDSAVYISKVYRVNDVWERKDYWIKSMKLQSEERFADPKFTRPIGMSFIYNEKGMVTDNHFYENEKRQKSLHYFDDGSKKAIVSYDTSGKILKQTGWDEKGVEIPDYIYEQEAYFPGGKQAWMAYLVSRINPNTAAKAKAKIGIYTVKVQFIINKEGKVESAEAISVPPECKKCGEEAVKIINSSPKWEHATQYGRPVIYQAIQHISWQVED